jgi:Trk-type K+ transport system membrane component
MLIGVLSFIVASIFVAAAIIDYGFALTPIEAGYIESIYHSVQLFFVIIFSLRLITNWRHIWRSNFVTTIVLGVLLYLTVLPDIVSVAAVPAWFTGLYHLFAAKLYMLSVVGIFAVMEISRGIISITRRRTNPAMLLAITFLVIIFFGTTLLMMPRSTLDGVSISLVDALFTATSSVYITGLTTVNLATTFSTEGLLIISLLVQIGCLGVMTITSFFALFFMGNTGLYDQFALRDMVQSDTLTSLMSTLLYILGFTLGIEAIGAFFIWTTIHGQLGMGIADEILFSLFHAVSAFCNAGFSTMSGNLGNPMIIQGHNSFYIVISLLIILGGIGFPTLVNFKNVVSYHIRYLFAKIIRRTVPAKYPHLTRLNTKIAISWTLLLLVVGTLAIALIEWNGAFAGMSFTDKLVQSFFNATSPRTGGFSSINLCNFSLLTLIIYIILMWIGGASQSTAGGIKVNTMGVAVASFISVVRGESAVKMFNREISDSSVRRAYATIFGSVMMIIICFVTLMILEPQLEPFDIFFETISALSTVGASLGITPELSTASRVFVSIMMFVGRVGLITVATSLFSRKEQPHYRLPEESVIIN